MIRLVDSLKLAYTKIRTRKIRLFVTVFAASLLFAGLAAGSLIFRGITQSIEAFSNEGFSKRYIVSGSFTDTTSFTNGSGTDQALIARAETLEKADLAKRQAAAKRLGIDYRQSDNDKAVMTEPNGNKYLNTSTQIGQQVIAEQAAANPYKVDMTAFSKQTGEGAMAFYRARRIANPGSLTQQASLAPLVNGKENYSTNTDNLGMSPGYTQGLKGITDSWTLMDTQLITPFLLPKQTLDRGADGSIPIVISYSAAQEILKLPKLENAATNDQKKERLAMVRRDVAGKTFDVCYRNAASNQLLQSAMQQQADLKQNGAKKDYVKPELLYALPASPCTDPTVQSDVRTTDTKQYDAKKLQFDREFGAQIPQNERLHFRVVGITPDRTLSMGMPGIEDILSSMTSSSLGTSWVSPMSIYDTSPAIQDVFRLAPTNMMESQEYFLAEYSSSDAARHILKNSNCIVQYPGITLEAGQTPCTREARPFVLQSFGSASLALEDIKATFRKFQLIAAGIIALIASLILMGMIGRIIADSRKETAVFRAVGASRFAIAQIYVTYTIYLVALIVLFALAVGLMVALYTNAQLSASTSIVMALLFNISNLDKQFYFYGIDWYDIGLIALVVAGASLLGALIPIVHNMRRNPIRDMRDE